jgi:2-amino-4-hydroxy-6-hydroxymethyldihydropteridine diphosphokinase
MSENVYILLGSNVGDRESYLAAVLARLEALEGLEITAVSSIYVSEAAEMRGENPSFLNQVIKGEYQYTAGELLTALEQIERGLGRTHKGKKQPRTIDCDILLFGDTVVATPRLTIPHAKLLKRPFALVPLLEIDPAIVHPGTHKPIAGSLSENDRKTVLLYKDHVARNI